LRVVGSRREESRVEEVESGDRREKDLAEGRDDRIEEERVVGEIESEDWDDA
jgi:hypothetical protein